MWSDISEMMHTRDGEEFHRLFVQFLDDHADQGGFIEYFVPTWYSDGWDGVLGGRGLFLQV